MDENNIKKQMNLESGNDSGQEGTATHSGWMHFYSCFSDYRKHCIGLGKDVMGNNLNIAVTSLSEYHSNLYSMAQQIFSFYDQDVEDKLTDEWLNLGDEVNEFLSKISDRDFRNQMFLDGQVTIDRPIKVKLLKYFNKIDRMAAEAGLLVGKEDNGATEPKKGLLGCK